MTHAEQIWVKEGRTQGEISDVGVNFSQVGPDLATSVYNPAGGRLARRLGRPDVDHVVRDSGDGSGSSGAHLPRV